MGSIAPKGMDSKASRITEELFIGILRGQEAGAKTADVCRKHGVSSASKCAVHSAPCVSNRCGVFPPVRPSQCSVALRLDAVEEVVADSDVFVADRVVEGVRAGVPPMAIEIVLLKRGARPGQLEQFA